MTMQPVTITDSNTTNVGRRYIDGLWIAGGEIRCGSLTPETEPLIEVAERLRELVFEAADRKDWAGLGRLARGLFHGCFDARALEFWVEGDRVIFQRAPVESVAALVDEIRAQALRRDL
jgi:hypothetical protein